jgi:hypothetical protein
MQRRIQSALKVASSREIDQGVRRERGRVVIEEELKVELGKVK